MLAVPLLLKAEGIQTLGSVHRKHSIQMIDLVLK
jgi:hypothetical protein